MGPMATLAEQVAAARSSALLVFEPELERDDEDPTIPPGLELLPLI